MILDQTPIVTPDREDLPLPEAGSFYPKHDSLIIDNLHLRGQMNTSDAVVTENIQAAIRRGHAQIWPQGFQAQRICLLGGGPSLNDTLPQLNELLRGGAKLVTTNGAYRWALDHHLIPSAQMVMDARETNARFVDPDLPQCQYMLASQCHPSLWDRVEGRPYVWIWHALGKEGPQAELLNQYYGADRWSPIGGGSTIVMRGLVLLRVLGYTRIDVFGCDSAWLGDQHHAYEQAENAHEQRIHVQARPDGHDDLTKDFWVAPWHLAQVSDFLHFLSVKTEMHVTVHGEGLLAHVVNTCASINVVSVEGA